MPICKNWHGICILRIRASEEMRLDKPFPARYNIKVPLSRASEYADVLELVDWLA